MWANNNKFLLKIKISGFFERVFENPDSGCSYSNNTTWQRYESLYKNLSLKYYNNVKGFARKSIHPSLVKQSPNKKPALYILSLLYRILILIDWQMNKVNILKMLRNRFCNCNYCFAHSLHNHWHQNVKLDLFSNTNAPVAQLYTFAFKFQYLWMY